MGRRTKLMSGRPFDRIKEDELLKGEIKRRVVGQPDALTSKRREILLH